LWAASPPYEVPPQSSVESARLCIFVDFEPVSSETEVFDFEDGNFALDGTVSLEFAEVLLDFLFFSELFSQVPY
jgi:hypothetical protein